MTNSTIALDLGGTHVRVAVVDADGKIRDRTRVETPTQDPEPEFVVDLIVDVASRHQGVACAVVGVPGIVDHSTESLVHAPNLPQEWRDSLSERWLGERVGLPVSLANDADMAAVGETYFGAGSDASDVVYVTISTGVGAGVVLNRKLVTGRFSGSEIGHTIIDRNLALTGKDGTVEGLGSGTALATGSADLGLEATGSDLADLVREGDPAATKLWQNTIKAAAIGIANLCWLVSPELVVIGGGVGMNSDLVLPIVKDVMADFGPGMITTEVVEAALGDDAGLAGAAAWWEAVGRAG